MQVYFSTPTELSLLDITTMGDSSKRNDPTKIGQFDSGLKYALALLLRHDIEVRVEIYRDSEITETFEFETLILSDKETGKIKSVISVRDSKGVVNGTGFSVELGYNWELWMALRELWANALDEGGGVHEDKHVPVNGTLITLDFNDSPFTEIWNNRHLYVNEGEPLFKLSNQIEVLANEENYLRIYKNNIQVYADINTPSIYAYNLVGTGELDERRILCDVYEIKEGIKRAILATTNKDYLRNIITPVFVIKENEFLFQAESYGSASETIQEVVQEVITEYGEVNSYEFIMDAVKRCKDCVLPGKVITSIQDSLFSYSTETVVEAASDDMETDESLKTRIESFYDFKVDVDLLVSPLKGSKVIADKHRKCLIVCPDFNVEEDFHFFIVQYLDLTQEGNVIANLGKYISKLIKK